MAVAGVKYPLLLVLFMGSAEVSMLYSCLDTVTTTSTTTKERNNLSCAL
jgi:hypothetical protein